MNNCKPERGLPRSHKSLARNDKVKQCHCEDPERSKGDEAIALRACMDERGKQ